MCLLVHDGDLSIRLMRDKLPDYQIMSAWLTDPCVLEFYEGRDRPLSLVDIQSHYGPRVRGAEDVTPCLIHFQSIPIGYIQFYPLSEESRSSYALPVDYSLDSVYGIDQFIGEVSYWNRGFGTRSISLLLRYLFQTRRACKVVLDPHVDNHRAIRCYEKCGFRIVKLLPAHELHEGILRDSWLMEVTCAPNPHPAP
jgi:aminoglycoside 6'-N-acetyltransferase